MNKVRQEEPKQAQQGREDEDEERGRRAETQGGGYGFTATFLLPFHFLYFQQ